MLGSYRMCSVRSSSRRSSALVVKQHRWARCSHHFDISSIDICLILVYETSHYLECDLDFKLEICYMHWERGA